MLNRVRQAFNVSSVGLAGAAAALDDPAHVPPRSRSPIAERARVARGSRSRHPRAAVGRQFPVAACRCTGARAVRSAAAQGVIVRPVANYGLAEHLRVTLGTPEQNDRFLSAWEA
jgi:histidinol-phosphate aminotransferase